MKITFLGATRTVTGSNILVETKDKKFIISGNCPDNPAAKTPKI